MDAVALDARTGASGDMLLGALLDLGGDRATLEPIATTLAVTFEIETRRVQGIAATDVTVRIDDTTDEAGSTAEGHGPHRHLDEVLAVIDEMAIPASVAEQARAVFHLLGAAEAAVHGRSVEEIHFHAVGADDAIADVVGTVSLLEDLDVERLLVGPVAAGSGEVETSHGTYPVPPPAVTEIAARTDLVIENGPVAGELLTPTGAALLGELADHVERVPALDVDAVGYGAGDRRLAERPNVLRATGGTVVGELRQEPIRVLETHVDDVTPEVLGHLQETLLAAGARDVATVPMTMKKSRPGHLVRVIVDPADEQRIARRLAAETGTLGVRAGPSEHRWVAKRDVRSVAITVDETRYECTVKIAYDEAGTVMDRSAEFDEAAEIAAATDRSTREIIRQVEAAAADLS